MDEATTNKLLELLNEIGQQLKRLNDKLDSVIAIDRNPAGYPAGPGRHKARIRIWVDGEVRTHD
jgi:hypothetical protein